MGTRARISDERSAPPLSRREFARGIGTAGAAAALEGWPARVRAQDAGPKKGGRVRIGAAVGNITDVLDPTILSEPFMSMLELGLRNNLTEVGPGNKIGPELAESWEASPDATVWRFQLRDGVEFHSGKPLTVADVVESINHHCGKDSRSVVRDQLDAVETIEADGKRTVVFKLHAGDADFPAVLSDVHIGIMPALPEGGVDWRSGVGTGAYALQRFQPGVRASLKRHSNYWKAGRGHFDEVELVAINDVTAKQNALIANDVDVIDSVDFKILNLLKRNPDIVVENIPGRLHPALEMDSSIDPFNDNNVRLALKYGINRKVLLDVVLRGYGEVANDHPISRAYAFFDPDLEQRAYDPDRALFHLKQAGRADLAVTLHFSDVAFNGAPDAAALYKEQAARGGITINLTRDPADGYFSKIWGHVPFHMNFASGRPTEDQAFTDNYAENAHRNFFHWKNEPFNELLTGARAELDAAKRRRMYYDMQRIVRDEGYRIIPVFSNHVFCHSKRLANGPDISSERTMDGCRFMERWWFA